MAGLVVLFFIVVLPILPIIMVGATIQQMVPGDTGVVISWLVGAGAVAALFYFRRFRGAYFFAYATFLMSTVFLNFAVRHNTLPGAVAASILGILLYRGCFETLRWGSKTDEQLDAWMVSIPAALAVVGASFILNLIAPQAGLFIAERLNGRIESAHQPALQPPDSTAPTETLAVPHAAIGVEEERVALDDSNAKDIWSTSVYSYAPDGGGPGGGRADDRLRVGGYGDEYVSLIKVPVNSGASPRKVWLNLYDNPDDGQPTPFSVTLVTSDWNWEPGDRLWWRDLPSVAPTSDIVVPAPTPNTWTRIDVTDQYNAWSRGDTPNYGLMLRPSLNQNNYDSFSSTRASPETRPYLTIVY